MVRGLETRLFHFGTRFNQTITQVGRDIVRQRHGDIHNSLVSSRQDIVDVMSWIKEYCDQLKSQLQRLQILASEPEHLAFVQVLHKHLIKISCPQCLNNQLCKIDELILSVAYYQ